MGTYLNPGNAGFQTIRNSLYVDKSGLISYINDTLGTVDKLTCVSRPRRFGKSFAAKMLSAYYDRSCDSRNLFLDLEISKDSSFEKHLNKYEVLYLDLIWFISNATSIKNTVKNLQHDVIEELRRTYPECVQDNETSLPRALSAVNIYNGARFIIIIDEWDALFREAKEDTDLQKEYIRLLRGLFKSSQTDKMIAAAYMTGILPIKKYGTQSAMTDFREYTMLQPGPLARYSGFTEQEVQALCDQFHMDFAEARKWYDGYTLGKLTSVYNPNSIIRAMKMQEYGSYWTQTETYESLRIYIDMNEDGLKEALIQMLGGSSFPIDTGTFQNDMTSINSKDDIFTLLVHLGYLAYDSRAESVFIPNEEIRREFIRSVKFGKHKEIARMIRASDQLLWDTLSLNCEAVAAAIEQAHSAGTTPLLYNNEQALRSIIRFAYISCMNEYAEIQELPSGHGFADIVYLPKRHSDKPALVIELKWNKTAAGAIRQIRERRYPQVLEKFTHNILLVGINYDAETKKHTCQIERYQN